MEKGGNCPKGGNHELAETGIPGTKKCKKCGAIFKTGQTGKSSGK